MYYQITTSQALFLAGFIADKIGIQIKPGRCWSADVKRQIIYYPKDVYFTDKELALLIHEAGHLKYTEAPAEALAKAETEIKKLGKNPKMLFNLLNSLEDIRIEHLIGEEFLGARQALDENNAKSFFVWLDNVDRLRLFEPVKYKKWREQEQCQQYCLTLIFKELLENDIIDRVGFNRWLDNIDGYVVNLMYDTDTARSNAKTKEDTAELFEHIRKYILPGYIKLMPDVEPSEEDKIQKALEKIIDQIIDEIINGGEPGQDGQEDGQDGQEDGQDGQEDGKDGQDGQQKGKDWKPGQDGQDEGEKIEARGNFIDQKKTTYNQNNTLGQATAERKASRQEVERIKEKISDKVLEHFGATRRAVNLLKDITTSREQRGLKRGKLDTKRLKKLFINNDVKVFKKKQGRGETKDFVIGLLADESGSMKGSRAFACSTGTALLAKALEQSRKPFIIRGFNRYYHKRKEASEKFNLRKFVEQMINSDGKDTTAIGQALMKMQKELAGYPEESKIIILLTDGVENQDEALFDKARKQAERDGFIVYAIDLQSGAMDGLFKNYKYVDDVDKLPLAFLEIFKKQIGKKKTA